VRGHGTDSQLAAKLADLLADAMRLKVASISCAIGTRAARPD
jgi:hypothetical protein